MSLDNELNLWRNTTGYGAWSQSPRFGYLTPQQNLRMERIRCLRMLYRGDHEQFYLVEGRTRHNFPHVRVQGYEARFYLPYNLLRLITLKSADLLLGARPAITATDDLQQEMLDGLVKRTQLHKRLYTAVKEASWAADAMVELVRWGGQVYVANIPPGEIYPEGCMGPDGQFERYVRFALADEGKLLLKTTYSAGKIQREVRQLKEGQLGDQVDLSRWPVKQDNGADLAKTEDTGIDGCTIIYLANEDEEGHAVSDYDGLIAAQDLVNAKRTQIARVLAKHSDPKLAAPESAVDGQGNLPAAHDVFFYRSRDEIPQYLVWNAELASAMEDFKQAKRELCIQAEMSEVLLGIAEDAIPQTARGLKLQATNSVAKAARKSINVQPFIERILEVAQAMEDATRVVAVTVGQASVEMRDGLPVDESDQAQTLATLKAGGLLSTERGVGILIPDPEAAAKEVALIRGEQEAATPSILFSGDQVGTG